MRRKIRSKGFSVNDGGFLPQMVRCNSSDLLDFCKTAGAVARLSTKPGFIY